jgi:O-methyltransferase involved in polyketide biosynthesis
MMDPVPQTSRWVAALRARESERPDRLFEDPLAGILAGEEGFTTLELSGQTPGMRWPHLVVPRNQREFPHSFLVFAAR